MRSYRSGLFAALAIALAAGPGVIFLDSSRGTESNGNPRTRRDIAHSRPYRPGNYRGQSPAAAQAAIAAAEAKRERRILRNKRLAGEVV